MSTFPDHTLTVRNRRDPLVIRTIDDIHALTLLLKDSTQPVEGLRYP